MNELQSSLRAASAGMQRQALRLRLTSENMANADTPGFQRKLAVFDATELQGNNARNSVAPKITLDRTDLTQVHDPSHPLADANGNYSGSNVNLLIEISDAREAQRSYEANLKMFEQARKMSSSLMDLLRRS